MHNDDEESFLLSVNEESTFEVPNSSVKKFRKFLIATVAILLFLGVSVMSRSNQSSLSSKTMGFQEIIRLSDGSPNILRDEASLAKPIDGVQIFQGETPIPMDNIPIETDHIPNESSYVISKYQFDSTSADSAAAPKIPEPSSNNKGGNLVLCTATVELKKDQYHAPKGCAMISDIDISYTKGKNPANLLIVCAPQNIGTFPLDSETLESFGMIKDNKSLISYISAGIDTSVAVYTGENFDGNTYVINTDEELKKLGVQNELFENNFNHWKTSSNDKIKSLIFHSVVESSPKSCKEVKNLIGYKESSD